MRKIVAYEVDNTTLGTVPSFSSHHFPGTTPKMLIWLHLYFDIPEEGRSWFPH